MKLGLDSPAGRGYGAALWTPTEDSAQRARISDYARWLAAHRGGPADGGYAGLWSFSVTRTAEFWSSIWDYFDVLGARGEGPVLVGGPMPDVTWFAGTSLNYARNALRTAATDPDRTAVVFRSEAGHSGSLSYGEVDRQVAALRAGLVGLGVTAGDRVAGYLPNSPQAIIAMLATASLGAIWTSCSPDFGARAVIDRFGQVRPKVLIAVDGYAYGGKIFDRRDEVAAIAAALAGLEHVIAVDYIGSWKGTDDLPVPAIAWAEFGDRRPPTEFDEVPFDHPLWVLYSSGTTGLPKPIVHGHGGIVLEHLKALCLHQDIGAGDVFFWYTTTGWMMWNYLAGGLLAGATVVAYDGSATHAETGVTYFGVGASYLVACMKAGLRPGAEFDLSPLRGVGSTGSPLPPEGFDWVYSAVARQEQHHGTLGAAIAAPRVPRGSAESGPRGAQGHSEGLILGSFSGGTDMCTGFVGPCPLLPVRRGIIAGPCLGAKVESFDPAGRAVISEV